MVKRTKVFGLSLVMFLALFVMAAGVSALTITKERDITKTSNGTIRITNNGIVNWSAISLTSSGAFTVRFFDDVTGNQVTNISLIAGQNKILRVVPVNLKDVGFGGASTTITAIADDSLTRATLTMNVFGSFCEAGSVGGDLKIRDIKIDNKGNGDDNEWKLLDTIEIEIEVENTGRNKIREVVVEIGLFDSDGKNQISELDFEKKKDEEKIEIGSINNRGREIATFKFRVPADFEDGSYKFVVKAYSEDLGEENMCVDTATDLKENNRYTTIDIERESDEGKFIAFENIKITPPEGTCGDRVTITMDVYNIGDEDQDQVKITLRNPELGINSFVEIRSDLDQGDKETVSFEFTVPENAKDKVYSLVFSAEYDYSRGSYRQKLDDDLNVQYRVIGCKGTPTGGGGGPQNNIAVIDASLQSKEVAAGERVIVKATITNLKNTRTAFAVDASGYQSWATLDSISPRIVDLQPNESKDVLLTFSIDQGVKGERSFELEVKDGLGGSQVREIALNIEEGRAAGNGLGLFDLGDSTFLWIIGAVNVILVILIIIVAVRVARR